MTVYIDEARPWAAYHRPDGSLVRQGHRWCHLWADDPAELHAFAARLGLLRSWFQDRPSLPHYDLMGERMRSKAVALGAVPMSSGEFARWMLERRKRTAGAAPRRTPQAGVE